MKHYGHTNNGSVNGRFGAFMAFNSKHEEALQKQKALLDATGRLAKVGGWELDLRNQRVIWSEMTCRIHEVPEGYSPSLDKAINFYHQDDQKLVAHSVMPEMNGRELAKNILSMHPNLKRLFMSGYTANVIAHHGILDEGVDFIQKPFSRPKLSAKVREVLDL
jgi:CheY-like chemotaxis protein